MSPVSDIDELYGLPLEDFVRERDALAKELRSAGSRADAESVKALPKPNRAAWAVNQLMRSQPQARRSLAEAASAAEHATERLGDPEAADELRLAASAGRRAVNELMAAARGLVSADGKALSESTLQSVADTLLAALADADVRRQVEEARLVREQHATGFPLGGAAAIAPGAAPSKRPAKKPAKGTTRATSAPKRDTAKEKRERAKAEREAKQAKAAQATLKRARDELARTEREVTRARTKAEAAVEALQEAETARERAKKAVAKAEKQAR